MRSPSASIENSKLWRNTLAVQPEPDPHRTIRAHLRDAFLGIRERASHIAAEIARDLPDYTVHDITHLDALWEMADIVIAPNDVLTPPEAFVLGCSFLVHDLGMGLAAYPDGEADLRKDPKWHDVIAALIRTKVGKAPTEEELHNPDEATKREAQRTLLRELHAEHAKKLPLEQWRAPDGRTVNLIVDDDIRQWAGETIGRIAYSHWLDVSALQSEFKRNLGAPSGYPNHWTVDPLKLCCLLRIADVIHIDSRRAPLFLRALRRLRGVADAHWNFQQKMNPPRLCGDRLEFTSGASFSIDEAKAWWLCYEYLQMIGRELRQVDALLADECRNRLAARSVAGIEDPTRFAEFVRPSGWTPVDARIHASDVIALVEKLGGRQLYGTRNDIPVPLRELIQNAADAIRARRALEKEQEWGKITVRTGRDAHGHWLEVEDDGIGMPVRVLTGVLLDFGSSYWRSNDIRHDWPGLLSAAFEPCGQYGIGFFSVFMWGHKVRVTSRPYHEAHANTRVLEFAAGPRERPLLREAARDEWLRQGGSRVRVWLNAPLDELVADRLSLDDRCTCLCPTLDVDLWVEEDGKAPKCVVRASDWLTISAEQLLRRVWISQDELHNKAFSERTQQYSPLVEIIRDDQQRPIGRACLHNDSVVPDGVVTIGGLRAQFLRGIAGVLLGGSDNAARNIATPRITSSALSNWISEQARRMVTMRLFPDNEYFEYIYAHDAAKVVARCGGNPGPLPIAYCRGRSVSADDIAQMDDLGDEVLLVFEGNFAHGNNAKNVSIGPSPGWDGRPPAELYPNVIVTNGGFSELLLGEADQDRWPSVKDLPTERRELIYSVARAVANAWSIPVESIYFPKESMEIRPVGQAAGEPVSVYARVLRRPKK